MEREDDQQLWDLLGRAKTPVPSAFFARNVVREVRGTAERRGLPGWSWLRARVLIPASALALVSLVGGVSLYRQTTGSATLENPPARIVAVDPQDYEVVADLDDLLAMEDDSIWDDSLSL